MLLRAPDPGLGEAMTEHANAELFRRSYAAFQAGDLDTVRSLLADDVTWHNPGGNHLSGDYRGVDAAMGPERRPPSDQERGSAPADGHPSAARACSSHLKHVASWFGYSDVSSANKILGGHLGSHGRSRMRAGGVRGRYR
jgi:hypothetical protein